MTTRLVRYSFISVFLFSTSVLGTPSSQKPGSPTKLDSAQAEVKKQLGHREYEAAEKLGPNNSAATEQLFKKAQQHYIDAVMLDPNIKGVYSRLGSCYFKLKKHRAALWAWGRVRVQDPGNLYVLKPMSEAHRFLGEYDQALALVQEGIRVKPDSMVLQELYGALGQIYFDLKQYEKAIPAYGEAARLFPPNYSYYSRLTGDAYYQLGRYPEAVDAYNNSMLQWGASSYAYYGLGLSYTRMAMKNEALKAYRALQNLDATKAQKLLDEIKKLK